MKKKMKEALAVKKVQKKVVKKVEEPVEDIENPVMAYAQMRHPENFMQP